MGRLTRPIDDDLVSHALNRGNNRAPVFHDESDHAAFQEALARTRRRYPFRLHGCCLMTNHSHSRCRLSQRGIPQASSEPRSWWTRLGHRPIADPT